MNPLVPAALLSIPCLLVPVDLLVILSVVGVMLADTRFIPWEYIYYHVSFRWAFFAFER